MAHSHRGSVEVAVAPVPRAVMLAALGLVAIATIVGLIRLWPSGDAVAGLTGDLEYAAAGVTFPQARITAIDPDCGEAYGGADPADGPVPAMEACQIAHVQVLEGERAGEASSVVLQGPMAVSGLRPGDTLQLMSNPAAGQYAPEDQGIDSAFGINRNLSLGLWTLAFVVAVVAIGRHRGALALLSLGFSGLMILWFVVPGLLAGGPGLALALVGASAIMYVALYVAHGPSIRTSAALAGTLVAVVITAIIAQLAVSTSRLSGLGDEDAGILSSIATELDFRGLLTCAIIIAGLGVLNDVTITQTSSVWELRAAAPHLPRRAIFARAMRIGRDHIASTIYTIVFAYAGAAMSVLLLLYLFDQPLLSVLTQEGIAIEIVRTLTSGIGLVLAVPITTAIAAVLVPATEREGSGRLGVAAADA